MLDLGVVAGLTALVVVVAAGWAVGYLLRPRQASHQLH